MRIIKTAEITQAVKKMCIDANLYLADDMKNALFTACEREENALGKRYLDCLRKISR